MIFGQVVNNFLNYSSVAFSTMVSCFALSIWSGKFHLHLIPSSKMQNKYFENSLT